MSSSLRDALVKSGLVDKKKAEELDRLEEIKRLAEEQAKDAAQESATDTKKSYNK